jgi:hypothetical protein
MPLTDATIRNAKPKSKQYKLYDEKGLYLLVKESGKYFRLDYRFGGKRKTLALGVYPAVKLAEAREKRDDKKETYRSGGRFSNSIGVVRIDKSLNVKY